MTEFVFVDGLPPEPTRGRNGKYTEFADALRGRPGEWAIWPVKLKNDLTARTVTASVRRGTLKNFPAGQFEATQRGTTVYARYVGGEA